MSINPERPFFFFFFLKRFRRTIFNGRKSLNAR